VEIDNPKPRKPWYRPRNVVLAIVSLVAFLIGRELWIAFTAVPGSRIDYPAKLAELVASYQPAGAEDGWPLLLEAIAIEDAARGAAAAGYPRSNVSLDYSVIGGPSPDAPRDEQGRVIYHGEELWEDVEARARIAMRIVRDRGLFDTLARLAQVRRVTRPVRPDHEGRLFGMAIPEAGRMRNLARIQRSRMILATESGDWADFAAAYEETLGLARIAAHQGLALDYLIGTAIEALAHSEARYTLADRSHQPPDPVALRRMLAAAGRQPFPPLDLALKGERVALDDAIQWSHSDNGRGSGRLLYAEFARYVPMVAGAAGAGGGGGGLWAGISGSRLINIAGVFFASKRETIRKADEIWEAMARLAPMTLPERVTSGLDPEARVESLSPRFIFLRMMMPALPHMLLTNEQRLISAAGARLMIAIELYRAEQGRLPATLGDLVPSVLDSLPIDRSSGKPFAYRVLDTPDRFGRDYLLYAVGADGADDGGRRISGSRQPTQRALQMGAPGFDYIINEPRFMPEDAPEQEQPDSSSESANDTPAEPPAR
jgi:hypothetical protein